MRVGVGELNAPRESSKVHLRRQSNQARVANKVAVVDFALKEGTKTPGQVCNSILLSASPAAMILFCVGVRPLGGGKDLWKKKKNEALARPLAEKDIPHSGAGISLRCEKGFT
jgi:hypothetical protein